MSKLTDKQRKQIVAEYVDGDGKISHRQLAQKFNVSQSTISKILKDEKSVQKCSDKKKANTLSMLAYIDSQSDKAQELIGKILATSGEKIESASLRDNMGALKVLAEVFCGKRSEEREKTVTDHLTLMRNAFSNEKECEDYGDE